MSVTDVRWVALQQVRDERGALTSLESGLQVPFEIRRVFFLHDVQGVRGGHAHRSTSQLLVPAAGEFCIELADGVTTTKYAMNDPQRALYVPPLTWIRLAQFSPGAVCLVLADSRLADVEYIRDWDSFIALTGGGRRES